MVLDLIDQFAIVAQQGDYEFRTFIMYVCLYALLSFAAVGIALAVVVWLKRYVDTVGRKTRIGVGVALLGVVVFTIYAGTKPDVPTHLWRFQFENGVRDAGSYCTNDLIHAEWTFSEMYAQYALRASYHDLTFTNEVGVCIDEWHQLEDAVVSDAVAEWNVPDATNMEVVCYAQYIRPPDTHTNGTYQVYGTVRTLATTNSPTPDYVTPNVRTYGIGDDGEEIELNPVEPPPQSLLDLLDAELLRNRANNGNNQQED